MDLDLIVRTTAILTAASLLANLLPRAAASTRHLVWHLAIVIVLLAPFIAPLAPAIAVPGIPSAPIVASQLQISSEDTRSPEPGTQQNDAFGTFGTFGTLGTLGTPGTLRSLGSLVSLVVLFWFALCWVLSGLSVWRGSRPAPESWGNEARELGRRLGLRRSIAVRESPRDVSPHVAGLLTSVVVMPASAVSWTAEARRAAIVHELMHIKRGDRRSQALAHLACAIYWFNPLVWYAATGLSRERERACDDEVLRLGAKASDYAALLLDLARKSTAWTPQTALSMARPSAIEGRLLSILADAVRTPHRSTRWLVGTGLVVITTAILGAQAVTPPVEAPAPPAAVRPLVKPQMVMALDEQQPSSVTSALIEALADTDRQVREHAAIALAVTPGAAVIDPLLGALKDPDAQVREKAAIGLAFRRDPRIVDPLLAALGDTDAQVREKAAIALGASGDARAIDALTKAMKDPDSQVREKAVAGLVLLGLRK